MAVSDDEMVVVRAMRQSFEMHGGAGSAVNSTGNQFVVGLTGQFDLVKAAVLIVTNLDSHRAYKVKVAQDEAARQQKAAQTAGGGAGDPV